MTRKAKLVKKRASKSKYNPLKIQDVGIFDIVNIKIEIE